MPEPEVGTERSVPSQARGSIGEPPEQPVVGVGLRSTRKRDRERERTGHEQREAPAPGVEPPGQQTLQVVGEVAGEAAAEVRLVDTRVGRLPLPAPHGVRRRKVMLRHGRATRHTARTRSSERSHRQDGAVTV